MMCCGVVRCGVVCCGVLDDIVGVERGGVEACLTWLCEGYRPECTVECESSRVKSNRMLDEYTLESHGRGKALREKVEVGSVPMPKRRLDRVESRHLTVLNCENEEERMEGDLIKKICNSLQRSRTLIVTPA